MPKGRLLRRDDTNRESLKITGDKKLDRSMLNSLVDENSGILPAGALPSTKAASAAGAKSLQEFLDDDKVEAKGAAKRRRVTPKEPETIEPKTIVQSGPPGMCPSRIGYTSPSQMDK